ncbi:hypothetical protein KQX54_017785 [Cotesia glomerata]|uniref:Uncharacterized protein n=1 Tax=Cotesia glomerata TaxID=32391 RepID=A0AAV7IAG7_COTGL|nr:hypothetical protein KQX54_017785 [Cotesia glomerata]
MYSLVFWTDSGKASVIKSEKIKTSSKAGFLVKLRNKNFPVKILLQNDNEEYLKKQTVDEAGNLIKKAAKPEDDVKNLERKVKGEGGGRKPKSKASNPIDAEIVEKQSIFDLDDQDDLIDKPESLMKEKETIQIGDQPGIGAGRSIQQNQEDSEGDNSDERPPGGELTGDKDLLKKIQSSSKGETSSSKQNLFQGDDEEQTVGRRLKLEGQSRQNKEEITGSSDAISSKTKSNKRRGTAADKNSDRDPITSQGSKKMRREKSSSSNDSDIDSSDKSLDKSENSSESKLFRKFLKWQKNLESKESKIKKHRKEKKLKPKEVELIEESNIFVNRFKLDTITELNKKNPREMTRQLFKLIIGTDELAKMTITQKKGREKMPDKYVEAVYGELTYNGAAQLFEICFTI